jgi:hypothetical protein
MKAGKAFLVAEGARRGQGPKRWEVGEALIRVWDRWLSPLGSNAPSLGAVGNALNNSQQTICKGNLYKRGLCARAILGKNLQPTAFSLERQ